VRLIDRSPCRGVIVPGPSQQAELDILSLDEVSRVLDAAQEPEGTLFAVLAYTGLRLGEGLGLKWKDIDFKNLCIRVERAYGQYGWSTPKTKKSRRAVPMSPTLVKMLAEYRRGCRDATPDGVVFSHDRTTPLDQSNVRRDFNKALKEAGIRHVSLNSLRHFYASNMIASGCSIKFLQNSLGHSSATMTLNTYSHFIPESGAESVTRFDALISGTVKSLSERKKR
jgi:integrase